MPRDAVGSDGTRARLVFELSLCGGALARRHRKAVGDLGRSMPWSALDPARLRPEVLAEARRRWTEMAFNEHRSVVLMAQLVQALGEASEDPELRRHLRRHMREVHDFVADLIRRGQAQGAIAGERDADSEAWIMLAGGILGMVGRRVGLLDDKELTAIRSARLAWLRG